MSQEIIYDEIRHRINAAKANHSKGGFDEPSHISEALNMIVDALELANMRRAKIEANIADRLGKMLAAGLDGEFIKEVILSGEPNYPYGKDDPDQLEFDRAVDNALRSALRGS